VRKVIYTTNAIESVNATLRKIIKTRNHFHSDDAATKLIWLALRNITAEWGRLANTGAAISWPACGTVTAPACRALAAPTAAGRSPTWSASTCAHPR